MKAYKLLSPEMQSYGSTKWTIGETKTVKTPIKLCAKNCLHFYSHPILAVLFNPIYANLRSFRLFEGEAQGEIISYFGTKEGCSELTLHKEIFDIPKIDDQQRIFWTILCVKECYKDAKWNVWADNYLSGKDRSINAARTAYVYAAAHAADTTYYAAYAAARAAYAYAYAAYAAANAADAAANAAKHNKNPNFNLLELFYQASRYTL